MATPWLRLWADMPNDPKWRTIARVSKQSIGNVVAVYIHMMVCASNAAERGRTIGWSDEDIGTALDLETEQVATIREAMQGRVLEGDYLAGWSKRQPAKEDEGAAARAKAWRESEKIKALEQEIERLRTLTNATEQNQTTEVEVEVDIEKSREEETKSKAKAAPKARKPAKTPLPSDFAISDAVVLWAEKYNHQNLQAHFDSFVGKARANGYMYVDWDQALQNAVREDWAKLSQQARASPGPPINFDPVAHVNRNRKPP